jgi:Fic family protein
MYTPRFTITPKINLQIADIEAQRVVIERSKILPSKEIVLRKRASVEATRSSTGIEGNPLSIREIELVLSGQKVAASERFITEVVNYKKALGFIEKRAQENTRLSVRDALSVHAIVMNNLLQQNKIGELRKTPIYIIDIINKKEIIRYEGPDPKNVEALLDDLFAWMKQTQGKLHPLLIAGIFHYEFVSIHPFADGNGRVTRLSTLLYLYQCGYGFRNILVPDSYYFSDRKRYYAALNNAKQYVRQTKADLTSWLEYFIEGMHQATSDISRKITLVSLPQNSHDLVTLSNEDYQIIEFISGVQKSDIEAIETAIGLPKRTVQRILQRLVQVGVLARMGKGRATTYQLRKEKK